MALMRILFLVLLQIFSNSIIGQEQRGVKWILGGEDGILMDFTESPVGINYLEKEMRMESANTSMCDTDGNLLFYSNGCFISNAQHQLMENGDTLSPGLMEDIWCSVGGNWMPQAVVSIPAPQNDSLYYLFNLNLDEPYEDTEFITIAPQQLFYNLIDMRLGNNLGKVIQKRQIVMQDTFARGSLQAIRHANGQDWWVIVPKSHSNCYFLTLVNSEGVQPSILKCVGEVWNDSDGAQSVFSPNGSKYIRFNYQNGLNIYDFDIENGDLSNSIRINFLEDNFPSNAGVSVSSSSRFLYASARTKLYQFDLEAMQIEESKTVVAEWDGFQNPNSTIFNFSALGPDNRIYIASSNSTLNLHVINKPNCEGVACEVEQHEIELPALNYMSIPTIPHYNYLPDITACDPVSLSEGHQSTNFKVYPNPVYDVLNIELPFFSTDHLILIYNSKGEKIYVENMNTSTCHLNLNEMNLSSGIYIYLIYDKVKMIQTGKFIKI